MFSSVKDRIEYEYERFRVEKIRHSKDNIYASSYEIEVKKTIRHVLARMDFEPTVEWKIVGIPNLLDQIYALMEENRLCSEGSVGECLKQLV